MSLAFLLDECCERSLGDGLRSLGFEVVEVAEQSPSIDDGAVSEMARSAQMILVTYDKGFGERAVRWGFPYRGLIIGDLGEMHPDDRVPRMLSVIGSEFERLEGILITVNGDRVRRRPLQPV